MLQSIVAGLLTAVKLENCRTHSIPTYHLRLEQLLCSSIVCLDVKNIQLTCHWLLPSPPCSYAYEIYTTFKFTNLPEQSTRFCSLRETSLPVALKCWPSREPVVLNAQQEPHWPWGWRKQPGIKVADTEHLTYITDLRHSVAN